MKIKKSVMILIGLIIVLGISLIYGTSELIFKNTKSSSPSTDENNQTIVMENPIDEEIKEDPVEKSNEDNNSPIINNIDIEDKDKDEGKNQINENTETNNIDNHNLNDDKSKDPEKVEDPNNDDKKNNKNNNNENKKNNDNNKGKKNSNKKNDKDKPILENNLISEEKAKEIGFKKVGSGGKLENIESYLEDIPPKYKIEIIKNKQKYKFQIHARTGAILEYEKEKIK